MATSRAKRVTASAGERRRARRERKAAKRTQNRMKARRRTPGPIVDAQMNGYRVYRDWPYEGTPVSERVAPDWLADATEGGVRLRRYSEEWRKSVGAFRCKQLAVHTTLCEALDQLICYDGLDAVNSAGVECLVRHILGLELAFDECTCEEDWRDGKRSVVQWQELEDYDVTRACGGRRSVAPRAQEQVRSNRERRARQKKAAATK